MSTWSSVPVADTAIDGFGRPWFLIAPALNPFESLWSCPEAGLGANWVGLNRRYGVEDCWNAGRYKEEVAP